ncbi:hypothetical protein JJD41_04950 [Oxynema sp. CENA135]|uniref:hypothetical protein n=1 Tax=Oxynema sp. CENA135 TaxID=984206 RepID=UPI00190970CC|nr:hypothetical protein [Oxynema sp. CENA135]MBK4729233.1 hypothetical protein [Oxynema sp. CENA135]
MSKDPTNSPESEDLPSQSPINTSDSQQVTTQSEIEKVRGKSPIKRLAIASLRKTIAILETTVEKLEAEPAEPETPGVWSQVLGKIRAVLPESVSQKLPDWGLTGAIAALVVLIAVSVNLLRQPPEPTSSDRAPILEPKEVVQLPPEQGLEQPETAPNLEPVEPAEPMEPAEPVEPLPPVEEPAVEQSPQPVEEVAPPQPKFPPESELTPEQQLIVAVQKQVATVADEYTDGVVESIQANFLRSLLQVTIADRWYELDRPGQDKLANKMFAQARRLDFKTLEISDRRGHLVARSPVVGSEIIIVKRTN